MITIVLADGRTFSAVKLVIGGGPKVVEFIKDTVSFGMPAILFTCTSQTSTLLPFAYNLKHLHNCNMMEMEEHELLVQMIGKEYPDFTQKMKIDHYELIMKCLEYKNYVRIFSISFISVILSYK